MEPVQACGGVVYREKDGGTEVLLIFRRGFWDIPKGKREPGESLAMCAAREVSEETGIPIPMIAGELGTTTHTYTLDGVMVCKKTWWYVMVSKPSLPAPQVEEGIEEAVWVPVDRARSLVGYQNLRIVLDRFARWIRSHS